MLWEYQATNRDFELIEKALGLVWDKKLDSIFANKKLISETNVISFDSEYLYLWLKKKNSWKMSKIKHKLKFSEPDRKGWSAWSDPRVINYLPVSLQWNYSIIGSLPTVFVNTQKKIKNSIYDTEESFVATIIHEFAHIYCRSYWDEFRTSRSNVIRFLKGKSKIGEIEPPPSYMEEVFAFCVEYEVSKKIFPQHANYMDNSNKEYLNKIVKQEKMGGVKQSSVFAHENGNHVIAMISGRKLIKEYPLDWEEKILNMKYCF